MAKQKRPSSASLFVLFLSVSFAGLVRWNPLLFGKSSSSNGNTIAAIKSSEFYVWNEHDVLDESLILHVHVLDEDLNAYRHHCLRVLSLAVHSLGGLRHVSTKDTNLMAWALVHTKLGLWYTSQEDVTTNEDNNHWMDRSLHLLERSIENGATKKKYHPYDWDEMDRATMRAIIRQQHQILSKDTATTKARLVKAVRQAIVTDLTMGTLRWNNVPLLYVEKTLIDLPSLDWWKILWKRFMQNGSNGGIIPVLGLW